MIERAWRWLQGTPGSWVGHGLLGFVIAVVGDLVFGSMNPAVYAIFVHFLIRETGDYINGLRSQDDMIDGAFDFLAAWVGLAVYLIFRILT